MTINFLNIAIDLIGYLTLIANGLLLLYLWSYVLYTLSVRGNTFPWRAKDNKKMMIRNGFTRG